MPQATTILGDRYELGPVLGHGGMGRVHRGKDRQLGRQVAVKVLSPPYDRDRAFVERFRREAHAAARLNHPGIVAVYDSGSDDGTHFIVTELVEGETLGEVLAREGALPPQRAVEIATDVARALAAAHDREVVHRDVKPSNVMLTPDGRVKVVDFGIARAAGAESVTRSGLVFGSAPFLSPEQARGEPGDARSDIYALGCVMYQMLTGQPPFTADTPLATLYLHVNETVTPPSTIRDVPPDLEAIVLRCLEKDPSERFASAGELENALAAVGDPTATMQLPPAFSEATAPVPVVEPSPASRPPRRDRRVWWLIGGVIALVLLIAWLAFALPDGTSLRDARRETRETRTESPTPTVEEPLAVDEAHLELVGAIQAAEATGGIDEGVADDLTKHADDIVAAYQAGNVDEMEKKIGEFSEKLAEAREKEEITFEAAGEIDAAFEDLLLAIEAAPPVAEEEPTDEDDGNGESGENGDGGESGGPPPWAGNGGNGGKDNGKGNGKGGD